MANSRGHSENTCAALPTATNRKYRSGKRGLSESVLDAIDTALDAHELIKVKISAERDQREQFVPVIEESLKCECVGTVGRMAILYREHPDPEKRKIAFPK